MSPSKGFKKETKQETSMNHTANKALLRAGFLIVIFDPEDGDEFLRNGRLTSNGLDGVRV